MNRAQGVLGTTVPAALLAPQGWAGLGHGVSLALFKVSQIAVVLFGCSASAAGWSIPAQMSMCV